MAIDLMLPFSALAAFDTLTAAQKSAGTVAGKSPPPMTTVPKQEPAPVVLLADADPPPQPAGNPLPTAAVVPPPKDSAGPTATFVTGVVVAPPAQGIGPAPAVIPPLMIAGQPAQSTEKDSATLVAPVEAIHSIYQPPPGPLAEGASEYTVQVTAPSYVPINANNDNGSGFARSGIPNLRDFNWSPTAQHPALQSPDSQLVPVQISVIKGGSESGLTGVLGTLTVIASTQEETDSDGLIKLWSDAVKTTTFGSVHTKFGETVFLEGIHESDHSEDTWFDVVFTPDDPANGPAWYNRFFVTITPCIVTATVTPMPEPNVNWRNRVNGVNGLLAGRASPFNYDNISDGITFSVTAYYRGLYTVGYVQNHLEWINGFHGSSGSHGGPGAWVFRDEVDLPNRNWRLKPGLSYPRLDAYPDHLYYWNHPPVYNGDQVTVDTGDSPETGSVAPREDTAIVDILSRFRMYVVAGYADGSIYAVAHMDWEFEAYADSWSEGSGVTNILEPNGVRAFGVVYNNEQPQQTEGPVAIQSGEWGP